MGNERGSFRRMVDARLSDIVWTADMSAVVRRKALRRRGARRRRVLVPVFAMLLMLLATTALAWGLTNGMFERAIDMQTQHGTFDMWSLDEKLELLTLFEEGGYPLDGDRLASARDEGLPEAERDTLATRLIMDEFAGGSDRVDAFSIFDILQTVKGPIEFWSLEDKAWYSAYLRQHAGAFDVNFDMVPGENDLTSEEAVALAGEAIVSAYGLEADALENLRESVSFFAHEQDGEPHWTVCFYNQNTVFQYSIAALTRKGEPMACERCGLLLPADEVDRERASCEEAEREAAEFAALIPPQDESTVKLSEGEAAALGKAAIAREFGLSDVELDELAEQARLILSSDESGMPCWNYFVELKASDGTTAYSSLVRADTGEVWSIMRGEGNG